MPVVAYQVAESGVVSDVRLKRRSGVAELDRAALGWAKALVYNRRPGCGVIESEASIAIDF